MPYREKEKQRAAVREAQQRRRAGGGSKTARHTLPALQELRFESARDVVAALKEQVNAVRLDAELGTAERARTVALLCSVLLRGFEQADIVARLEALESGALPPRLALCGGKCHE